MNAVLVTVVNGQKIVDSGSGIVLGIVSDALSSTVSTWILTCAHTLRAVRTQNATNPIKIKVNGVNAAEIQDELLAKYDLVVLNVEGKVGDACKLGFGSPRPRVECNGFTGFHLEHFWQREVSGKVSDRVPALLADANSVK
jgi:hypothetical protein